MTFPLPPLEKTTMASAPWKIFAILRPAVAMDHGLDVRQSVAQAFRQQEAAGHVLVLAITVAGRAGNKDDFLPIAGARSGAAFVRGRDNLGNHPYTKQSREFQGTWHGDVPLATSSGGDKSRPPGRRQALSSSIRNPATTGNLAVRWAHYRIVDRWPLLAPEKAGAVLL